MVPEGRHMEPEEKHAASEGQDVDLEKKRRNPGGRQDEAQLLKLAAEGDNQATEELLEKYRYLVRRQANPLFLSGGDSDDLNQEGMIGLYQAIRSYDPEKNASFSTFAWMCIRRKMLSAVSESRSLKNHALNTSVSLEVTGQEGLLEEDPYKPSDEVSNPEALLIRSEEEESMVQQLSGLLSPYEKRVFSQYLSGLKVSEIAQSQGKSIKSVENALQRIRQKIRQNKKGKEEGA